MSTDHVLTDCPACGSANRIPLDRLGQKGRCGRCKGDLGGDTLYASAPVPVTEGQLEALARASRIPVLVDFWAEWCAPCRQLAPVLEQLASNLTRKLLVLKLDTEAASIVPARYGIRAIPTLVLLRSGIEVERITGLVSLEALRQRIERFL